MAAPNAAGKLFSRNIGSMFIVGGLLTKLGIHPSSALGSGVICFAAGNMAAKHGIDVEAMVKDAAGMLKEGDPSEHVNSRPIEIHVINKDGSETTKKVVV